MGFLPSGSLLPSELQKLSASSLPLLTEMAAAMAAVTYQPFCTGELSSRHLSHSASVADQAPCCLISCLVINNLGKCFAVGVN